MALACQNKRALKTHKHMPSCKYLIRVGLCKNTQKHCLNTDSACNFLLFLVRISHKEGASRGLAYVCVRVRVISLG